MIELDTVLSFGKYKFETVGDVIDKDPDYIEWCLDSVDCFYLSDEAFNYLQECRE